MVEVSLAKSDWIPAIVLQGEIKEVYIETDVDDLSVSYKTISCISEDCKDLEIELCGSISPSDIQSSLEKDCTLEIFKISVTYLMKRNSHTEPSIPMFGFYATSDTKDKNFEGYEVDEFGEEKGTEGIFELGALFIEVKDLKVTNISYNKEKMNKKDEELVYGN